MVLSIWRRDRACAQIFFRREGYPNYYTCYLFNRDILISILSLINCIHINGIHACAWSLSGHHCGDKETMDNNILINLILQSNRIVFKCDISGDGT